MHKPADPGDDAAQRERVDALPQQHPNIAAAHDSAEGETLRQYLVRVGRLPMFQGLALVTQLLSALAFAHRQGRVHGAIHPQRLLVSRTGQLKVDGFGGAEAAAALAASDAAPCVAPEQRRGLQPDPRADLYAAAVVAYEVLTGALPFPPADARAPGARPCSVRALRTELPVALDAVFQRALAHEPGERYPQALALMAALHAALGSPMWERPPAASPVAMHVLVGDLPEALASLLAAAPILPPPGRGFASGASSRGLGLALVALVLAGSLLEGEPPASGADAARPVTVVEMHAGPAQPEPQAPAPRVTAAPRTDPVTSPAPTPRRGADPVPKRPPAPSPTLGCGRGDSVIVRQLCIARQCAQAEFRRHPICVRIHAQQRARNQLAEARGGP